MKHIQKKFLFEYELENKQIKDCDIEQRFDIATLSNNTQSILKPNKNRPILLETEFNKLLVGYAHVEQGKACLIPLPDFTLVYYDNAYNLNNQRKEIRKQIFKEINEIAKVTETASKYFYTFYGVSTSCIINMFTCLESFTNSILDHNFIYERVDKGISTKYNSEEIQKKICFTEKVNKVLVQTYSKSFFKTHEQDYNKIIDLKKLRDEIVHTKSDATGELAIKIFKTLIDFKYDESLKSLRVFMNFYKPAYIVDCTCSEKY